MYVCDEVWRGVRSPSSGPRRVPGGTTARRAERRAGRAPGRLSPSCRGGRDSPRLQIAIAVCGSSATRRRRRPSVTSVVDALCRDRGRALARTSPTGSAASRWWLAAFGAARRRASAPRRASGAACWCPRARSRRRCCRRGRRSRARLRRVDVMVHAFSRRRDCRGFRARDDLTTLSEPLGVLALAAAPALGGPRPRRGERGAPHRRHRPPRLEGRARLYLYQPVHFSKSGAS